MENLDRAIALMTEAGFLEEQVDKASELRERLSQNELIVSVAGQFKRGKSSLINAMLRGDILPVGIVPLTAVVTEIRRGDRFRAVVKFENGSEKEARTEDLSDYISEQKNKNNHKRVGSVKLWATYIPFGSGVTLVDTPGVGSIHQHNTETSLAYLEKSDAVLFLLSVDSPVSEVERDFLIRTREYASKFYFAVNKVDTVSERNREEFIAYSAGIITDAVGFPATLYAVSAETGEGVDALTQKIAGDIRVSHDDMLWESVAFKLGGIIGHAKSKISLYLKAAAIPSDKLKEKLSALREKQQALSALSDEVQALTRRRTEKLITQVDEQISTIIADFMPEMEAESERLYLKLKDLPSREFERRLTFALEGYLRDRLAALDETGLEALSGGYASIIASLNGKALETARFVSGMVKEFFDVEYAVEAREYAVSERSDFYIRFMRDGNFFLDTSAFIHLLPKNMANARIYRSVMIRMREDINRNKTNMLSNYRYKMQESLRFLCLEFSEDISKVNTELNGLLEHAEQSRQRETETFRETEEKLAALIESLDKCALSRMP